MARKILEGLWDCPYCGIKAIGGLVKHCPNCGHPQDQGTKFYMGSRTNYLEDDIAQQYGQGADWLCPFCGSLNRVHFQYCANCGSPKESSEKDYFAAEKEREEKERAEQEAQAARTGQPSPSAQTQTPAPKGSRKGCFIILALILALIVGLFIMNRPKTYDAEVLSMSWERAVEVDALRTVKESDWSVPAGGEAYDQRREIHHYEQILDHYETRTQKVPEEVYDGEDTHTRYVNNGDGTFSEETYTTPRYRTEYRTETYKQPIYRSDPVYSTKYYYTIDRWVYDRTERTRGTDDEPCWPEVETSDTVRTGERAAVYEMSVKMDGETYSIRLSETMWKTFKKGDKINITVSGGTVTAINDQPVY